LALAFAFALVVVLAVAPALAFALPLLSLFRIRKGALAPAPGIAPVLSNVLRLTSLAAP
jgi:hypothetical protein